MYFTERPAPDALEDAQMTPVLCLRVIGQFSPSSDQSQRCQHLELLDQRLINLVCA
ncbi:MAG TPA: hypothetical protein VKE51_01890 [Vicinamibacterales bacterium]|nr:hypothetical protein [Vicinamibacterales bacterium]